MGYFQVPIANYAIVHVIYFIRRCFPEDLSPQTTHSTFCPLSLAEEPLCVEAAWLAGVAGSSSSSLQLFLKPNSRGGRSGPRGQSPGPPTPPYTSAPCVMMPARLSSGRPVEPAARHWPAIGPVAWGQGVTTPPDPRPPTAADPRQPPATPGDTATGENLSAVPSVK
ncbi:hypothetical protein KGM_201076 [Danaus plexippus plexippus]|uniref:Uncharacterized protein n=1 Tax=Danaus plexippus plexippus TaxID=278856 RepID=A0A212EYX0_DANPL|nr:hypothetical protein KGM_201076 [Danaus plexippus plexippus]